MMNVTRLAPSPTGALHLGNARTFLVNWLLARKRGWRIVLRIEDLDGPRIKRGAAGQLVDDLQWLGFDWDEGPVYQSSRRDLYHVALQKLIATDHAYACVCSRKEVEAAASAPHAEDGAAVYPGTCRGMYASVEAARDAVGCAPALRFKIPARRITEFNDAFAGLRAFDVATELGDFVIAKSDGTPAYQLAVVLDDIDMKVTHIIRGDDLIDSTPRQILLYEALGFANRIPTYIHLPLVIGPDGRRLAKRHGDTRLSYYRSRGVAPQHIVALLARWCGIKDAPEHARPVDLLSCFDLRAIPRNPITFTGADHAWLESRASKHVRSMGTV
jgi:glutamyl-tRNA synthetase